MKRSLTVFFLAAIAASARAQSAASSYPFKPVPLADSAEISLAVSAAPPEISGQATVYAVRDGKVLTLRSGSSGVACLVARDLHEGSLYPICFNAEGARTALQRELLQLRLRSLGVAEDSIDHVVTSAYARGELGVPRELAVAYMMSPRQVLFSSPAATGRRVGAWHPHLMFYVPGATPAKFGVSVEGADDPIQVGRPGTPEAEMIVKLPKWADGSPVASAAKNHD
jgi:hypothetical protein